MAGQEEDYSSLPLSERVTHKIWKGRVSAYEELAKKWKISDREEDFRPFEGALKNIAGDSNVVAQETGLSALLAFVENAPNPVRTRSGVVPVVVEKGLGSARAGTKEKAKDLILLYIEVDVPDPVVEDVLNGLKAKQPKLVANTVGVLKEIVSVYGAKTVNVKPVLKSLAMIFAHPDKNVRAEGTRLAIELYKWLGQAIKPNISELKPVQIKELEEAFEKLPKEKPTQQRLLRSQQAAAEAATEAGGADAEEAEEEKEIDAYDLIEPVDVLKKMPNDFYEQLKSTKWKDRKEALEKLLENCRTPRIADGNYGELVGALAKRMSDSNVLVVALAANIVECLAKGLRNAFSKYKQTIISPMIEKLKEKNKNVTESLKNALDAVFDTVTITDVTEDILTAGKHKNPQVKTESMNWLVRCLRNTKTAPSKTEIKSLTEMMARATEDSFEPVRLAAFEGLGTMMKVIGEKGMNPFLENVDDIKKGKIKEFYEKAEVKVKVSAVKRPPPAPAPSKAQITKPKAGGKPSTRLAAKADSSENGIAEDEPAAEPRKLLSKSTKSSKMGPTKKPAKSSAVPAAGGPPQKKAKGKVEEPIRYKFTSEQVEEKFSELISETETADLSDKNWKLRLAAIENLHNALDDMDIVQIEPELVVRFLGKKPGWKENNFQVLTKAFKIVEMLAKKSHEFPKPAVALIVPVLVEKLGDIKLKKAASDCLGELVEKISLQFILSQAFEPLRKAKSPKVLADSLTWIHDTLMTFGIVGVQVRELIDFLKFALTSSNAAVRTNAVTCFGTLRVHVGPGIRSFVQDLDATKLAIIDAEFEKVADQAPPQPTKTSAETANSNAGDALEELFPKVDIGAMLNGKIVADCSDDKWKTRKEGMDQVKAILEANQRIKPSLGDFPSILKARLADNNKALQLMALEICGKIATAMGKPFERYAKMFVGPVTAVLTDQKANVRSTAISALDAMATSVGLDPLVTALAVSLANENPLLRKDLLTWLSERLKQADEAKKSPDLTPIVPPLLSCLSDRNGDVRKTAQVCLGPVVNSAGYNHVMMKCGDLKGAVKQSIMPMIEAVKPVGGGDGKGKENKKPGLKPKLGAASGKDKQSTQEDEDEEDEDPPPRLPSLPGPKRSFALPPKGPLASSGRGGPSGGMGIGPAAASLGEAPGASSSEPQASAVPSNLPGPRGLQPPSGIGRGLPPPSRLQSSRLRKPVPTNGQTIVPSADEGGTARDPASMDDVPEPSMNASESVQKLNTLSTKQRTVNTERSPEMRMDYIINRILTSDHQASIEALKEVDKVLVNNPGKVAEHVDELVSALALQIRLSYTQLESAAHILVRLCKHLVNALVLLFSNKDLSVKVSRDCLIRLLTELAQRLLDPNLQALESGQQLSKALNVAMVKVLENSDRNAIYSALISILDTSSSNLRDVQDTVSKFTELIMKCLWKLAKTLQDHLKAGTLKPNMLLHDLNKFFQSTPPAEWKRRAAEKVPLGEMPLRTAKTLLIELVTGLGDNVYDHLDLIEDPQHSYVYPYLHHMLEACRKKTGGQNISRPSSIGSISGLESARESPSLEPSSHDANESTARELPMLHRSREPPVQQQPTRDVPIREIPTREIPTRERPVRQIPTRQIPTRQAALSEAQTKEPTAQEQPNLRETSLSGIPQRDTGQHDTALQEIGKHENPAQEPIVRSSPVSDVPSQFNETLSNGSEPVSPTSPHTPMSPHFPTSSSARSSGSHELEVNSRLTRIFQKIGTREESRKGIYELYEFQKQHPEMEGRITAHLEKTGVHFQSYIRRALANITAEEEERERVNAIAEVRTMFPSTASGKIEPVNAGGGGDDEYRQRLLHLQQMFGYRNENTE